MNMLSNWKGLGTATKKIREHELKTEYKFCYRCGRNVIYSGGGILVDSKGLKRWTCDFHFKKKKEAMKRKAK